ncbi:MAG: hypothetical protein EB141_10830, partial [Verrucomicrobia bacterium]|nr:hypothetical protein [Verrucomicrobiota bacterium]
MWGAAKHERATGVHRPLRATVAIFEAAEAAGTTQRQILLALDHCILGAVEHGQLVAHIAQATGQAAESILVVFSHPNPESFVAALDRCVVSALSGAGHEVRHLDLHAEGFDPAFSLFER